MNVPIRLAAHMRVIAALTAILAGSLGTAAQTPDQAKVPGVIIAHSPQASGMYIGSPSVAVLTDGSYVASHDLFGPKSGEAGQAITRIFRSTDRGTTWQQAAELKGQFWGSLFVHRGDLYIMGTSATHRHGHCVIRKSRDGGRTWTDPTDKNNGLLFGDLSYTTAPVPVIVHKGRIWRAMEDEKDPGGWGDSFRAFMMSAPVDADLLRADSWTSSNSLSHDKARGTGNAWLEGNAVVAPDGNIVDVLRVGAPEVAAIVRISADGTKATFDPNHDYIHFHGGMTKFTIRYDATTGWYWSLVNKQRDPTAARNRLVLVSSADLRDWTVEKLLLEHPDSAKHAFQYVDWLFEGNDIIAVSRTAYDDGMGGAHNAHDANYLTFHRFERFRTR